MRRQMRQNGKREDRKQMMKMTRSKENEEVKRAEMSMDQTR